MIDELEALPVLTEDVAPKNGEIPQGGPRTLVSPLEGWRYIARVVALPDRFVAMQVNQVDASSLGMLSGGTVIIAFLTEDGHIRNVHRLETDAALIGRNAQGAALLARYADSSFENYEILQLDIAIVG